MISKINTYQEWTGIGDSATKNKNKKVDLDSRKQEFEVTSGCSVLGTKPIEDGGAKIHSQMLETFLFEFGRKTSEYYFLTTNWDCIK